MVNMPMLEYRMKREERKLAKYDLKKAQLDLEKTYAQVTDTDAHVARTVQRVLKIIFIALPVIVVAGSIDGMYKEYIDQKNVTACEKFVTEQHLVANCAAGIIGKTRPDGK